MFAIIRRITLAPSEEQVLPDRVGSYLRIGVVTRFMAFLGVLVGIQLPGMRPFNLRLFLAIVAVENAANLFYLLVGYKRWPQQAFHVTGLLDVAALGGLIYLTGGSHSAFAALYMLVIVFNGIFYGSPGILSGAIPSMISFPLGSLAAPEPVSWSIIGATLAAWTSLAFLSAVAGEREKANRIALLERAAQISAIYETSSNISNQLEAEGLILTATDRTHELAKQLWGPDVVTAITTFDPDRQEMTVTHVQGLPGDLLANKFPMTMLPDFAREKLSQKQAFFIGLDNFHELRELFRLPDNASAVVGPIWVGGDLLGVLSVRSDAAMSPSPSQLVVIETIANHVGTALARLRELSSERRRREQALVLFALARDLRAITDLETVLHHIARDGLSILEVDACTIGILTEDGTALVPRAWAVAGEGQSPTLEDVSTLGPIPIGVLKEAVEELRPMQFTSLDDQPELARRIAEMFGYRSGAVLPIIIRDQVAGAIGFGHLEEGVRFSIQRLQIGEAIASLAAVAIDHVRLYESDMQSAREHAALFDVARLITETLDPGEVSERVAAQSVAATGAASATIFLARDEQLCPQNQPPAHKGLSVAGALPPLPLDQTIKRFIQSGRVAMYADPTGSPLRAFWPRERPLEPHCLAPLSMHRLPIGLLLLELPSGWKGQFFENLVAGIAALASAALDNAVRFEAEKVAVEQLKELDRLKTEAVSTASHQLRSPLTSISGFARTLLRAGADFSEEERREFLHVIDQQAKQLSRLIDELLTVSRIEEGGMPLTLRPVDLQSLVLDTVAAAKGRTTVHRFEPEFADDFPPVVADEGRLREIVANLVDNAIKYSPHGGKVTIGGDVQAGEVHIFVKDEGVGIVPEEFENVFGKFYQVHGRPKVAGTGLGLYIVQELVAAHDGKIWVESEKGKGTSFHMTLPQRRTTDRLVAERGALERS